MKIFEAYHKLTEKDIKKYSKKQLQSILLNLIKLDIEKSSLIRGSCLQVDTVADILRMRQ